MAPVRRNKVTVHLISHHLLKMHYIIYYVLMLLVSICSTLYRSDVFYFFAL